MDAEAAATMVASIAFFPVIFTPLFGALVDKMGKATSWMILGSVIVFLAHIIIGFAPASDAWGYLSICFLGIGYSLVPSAMWPSVPKIIPEKNLGTAYSMIYFIQNLGMLTVPIFAGRILGNEQLDKVVRSVHAEYIFIGLGVVAISVSLLLKISAKKNPQLALDEPNLKK